MKDWEIIADNLSKAGWSYGCNSRTNHNGRQFWVVAAEREDAGRFILRADEKLTAFVELTDPQFHGIGGLHLRQIVLTNGRDFSQTRRRYPDSGIRRRTIPSLGSLPFPRINSAGKKKERIT